MVGPTVHFSLVDVLLRFRYFRIGLSTDLSHMYQAILLPTVEQDLHRIVWRGHLSEPLKYYRMTCITIGIASSSFTANMSVRQTSIDHANQFPPAAVADHTSF